MSATALPCIFCGYDLSQSRRDGLCPECGRPANDSYPDSRPGTRWQNERTFAAWWATAWALIRDPEQVVSRIRFDPRSSSAGSALGVALCAGLWPFGVEFAGVVASGHDAWRDVEWHLYTLLFHFLTAWLALGFLWFVCRTVFLAHCAGAGLNPPAAVLRSLQSHASMPVTLVIASTVWFSVVITFVVSLRALFSRDELLDSGLVIASIVAVIGAVAATITYLAAMWHFASHYLLVASVRTSRAESGQSP